VPIIGLWPIRVSSLPQMNERLAEFTGLRSGTGFRYINTYITDWVIGLQNRMLFSSRPNTVLPTFFHVDMSEGTSTNKKLFAVYPGGRSRRCNTELQFEIDL
jgi:hypothetical protein